MAAKYSDIEIAELIAESKPLPERYSDLIRLKDKRGHKEREIDFKGEKGNDFRLILRQSNANLLDFSIILAFMPSGSNQLFRLKRYNGKSHEHTNTIENESFYDFHIHTATERYQEKGMKEDWYGGSTERFSDFTSALRCMLKDCGFVVPDDGQEMLFGEEIP